MKRDRGHSATPEQPGVAFRALALLLLAGAMVLAAPPARAADEENCLLCHKYPGLGRIDGKTGRLRLFYVDEGMYRNGAHAKILCRECHLGVETIPHVDPPRVDCSARCHIKEPSTDKDFTHKKLTDEFAQSAHGPGTPGNLKKFPQDMPLCTDCHTNPSVQPIQNLVTTGGDIANEAVHRCLSCHENEAFVSRYYQHFAYRTHRSRTSLDTVKLCLLCHQDEEKMGRHGLVATGNFQDTFHWKAIVYGDPNAPDCISCHAPIGYSIHSLHFHGEKNSPVNRENLVRTCSNPMGTQKCHPGSTITFASGSIVHRTGLGFGEMVDSFIKGEKQLSEIESLRKERRFRTLFAEGGDPTALSDKELFEHRIYGLVKYLYKILISCVIGGMILHQLMDLLRTFLVRRKSKRGLP